MVLINFLHFNWQFSILKKWTRVHLHGISEVVCYKEIDILCKDTSVYT